MPDSVGKVVKPAGSTPEYIYYDVEQNTPEWYRLRLGIPTASEFHRILTPKTRRVSTQAAEYMYRLLGEWITGEPAENAETEWMARGHELEAKAVQAYEVLTGLTTTNGGFITTADGLVGCSPDRLVGGDGDLEIKCPLIATQVRYALTGCITDDYLTQLQGRLMIHGRQWVDIFSYHPAISLPPVRVHRDEQHIETLRMALAVFVSEMLTKRCEIEEKYGPFVRLRDVKNDEFRCEPFGVTDMLAKRAEIDARYGLLGVSDADVEQILAARGIGQ